MEPVTETFVVSSLIRLITILYGIWHDINFQVKYTDVDYFVFNDAATFVYQGHSPYERDTYRYTPILAWMLLPNVILTSLWGKFLFCIFDLLAGYLIYKILLIHNVKETTALLCTQLWLLNPLTMTVSSRGNAESMLAALVLLTLFCLSKRAPWLMLGAVIYGLAVHMKIYPITYALPIYLSLQDASDKDTGKEKHSVTFSNQIWRFIWMLWPTKSRLKFVATSVAVFVAATVLCYYLYGYIFVYETYLYHVVRRDTRHNFSPYFYMLYLTAESEYSSLLGLAAFLPQAMLLMFTSFSYYTDLPFCCFLNTFIFVTFNKVCTSQYFLWYLSLLPLIVPKLRLSLRQTLVLVAAWFLGQALWLLPAYYLEFEGRNTFIWIWLAGLAFFAINVFILSALMRSYSPRHRAHLSPLHFRFPSSAVERTKAKAS